VQPVCAVFPGRSGGPGGVIGSSRRWIGTTVGPTKVKLWLEKPTLPARLHDLSESIDSCTLRRMLRVMFEGIIVPGVVAFLALVLKLCGKRNGEDFDVRSDLFIAWEVLLATIGVGGAAWVAGRFGDPENAELASRGLTTAVVMAFISVVTGLILRFAGYDPVSHKLRTSAFWALNLISFGLLLIAVSYI
jgi:hypothetical protein